MLEFCYILLYTFINGSSTYGTIPSVNECFSSLINCINNLLNWWSGNGSTDISNSDIISALSLILAVIITFALIWFIWRVLKRLISVFN